MDRIDARGISCPQPVLMTKNALKSSPKKVEILVDNETARGNVERFLSNSGYEVSISLLDEDILLIGKK